MATDSSVPSDRPYVIGAVGGLAGWILGYAVTYLLVAAEIRESALHRVIEAFEGEPATYEMVGWVWYNAHSVDTVFRNVPFVGGGATNYIGGEDGFTVALYLLPPAILLAAGLAVARSAGATETNHGAIAGLTVLPGYVLLSAAGVFLFEVSVGQASGAPDLLPAVVLAGLVYPALFAGAGGVLAAITAESGIEQPAEPAS